MSSPNQTSDLKRKAIKRTFGKKPHEIRAQALRAKIIGEPKNMIQTIQQMQDNQTIQRTNVVLSAWTNYCRTSWIYRLLERFGLR